MEGVHMPNSDVVYTLTAHDTGYPGAPDQVVGLFGDAELAMKAANEHWADFMGLVATSLEFTSHDSENTGHDFHVATGDFYLSDRKVTYSVNGFTVQRA